MMDLNRLKELKGDTGATSASDTLNQAKEDFRTVLGKLNILSPPYLCYQAIVKDSVTIGYALAVPFEVEKRQCAVSGAMIKTDDQKFYVALVCYQGGKPIDILMFNSVYFANRQKPIKFDKKTGEYIFDIKDIKHKSMEKHAFGHVIRNLLR